MLLKTQYLMLGPADSSLRFWVGGGPPALFATTQGTEADALYLESHGWKKSRFGRFFGENEDRLGAK